jgi:hypothetical protein
VFWTPKPTLSRPVSMDDVEVSPEVRRIIEIAQVEAIRRARRRS